ncbi:FixH family protein [Salsuginibacillus kocurii]|uniref:FixH family protein n=1 Tax=Salsuginibacillus kocurii TaxID=427078 RepID=UPI000378A4A4|nr:FixH family protein [Salsuginibacillus kocurii]
MNKIIIATGLFFMLTACGTQEEDESSGENGLDPVEPIDVEVTMDEEIEPGDHMLETKVTQADEPVTDADEVVFEVWEHGQKHHSDMVEKEEQEEGVYRAEYSFAEDGIYHVQPHVTARDMHSMPVHDVIVGDVDQEDIDALEEEEEEEESEYMEEHGGHDESDEHSDSHEHEHEHEDHHSDVLETFFSKSEVDGEYQLNVQINKEGIEFQEGDVRFEIWKDGEEDRIWLDASEEEPGSYTAETELEEDSYQVMIHVEKDDLHEHEQETLEID